MKPCPFCGEQIQEVAVKCRYCGEWLDPSRRPEVAAAAAPVSSASAAFASLSPSRGADERPLGDFGQPSQPAPTSGLSHMFQGAAPAEPVSEPPPSSLAADSVFSTTLRGGIPPLAVEPRAGAGPIAQPEPERRIDFGAGSLTRPGEFAPLGGELDLDVLPALSPVHAAPPLPLPSPPAQPIASAPLPAPPSEPPPSFQARPADEFMQAFLGAAEPVSDSGGDDDLFATPAPPPPPPWPLIGAVAAVVVALALYAMRDSLFGEGPATDPLAEATTEALPPEAKAPEVKAEPPPEAKLVEAPKPPTPPPAPTDAAFTERLEKAKDAYKDGKLKVASAALAELSQQAPDHPEVLLLTAQVQLEQGKMAESRTTADKCVAVDPNLADCWLTLGVLRQAGKDDAGAVVAYETYLKLAPTGRYARDANSQLARLRRSAG